MNTKGHVKILLDVAVALLVLLAFADLASSRFGEFIEDCGFATLLLLLNLDWPRHALKRQDSQQFKQPRAARPAPRLPIPDREPETAY